MEKDLYLKKVGLKIREVRMSKSISITKLAALCGMDYSNFSRLENGQKNTHIFTLKIIADKLKVDVKDFL
jgi:transcriptional regulator with XRE-family HTH domain